MKRFILIAPMALLVAGCGGGPRHAIPSDVTYAPPPAHAEPPPVSHVTVPPRVPSAGPLKTAQVSAYMDNQERDVRQSMRRYRVIVARRGDGMVLNATNDVLFAGSQISAGGSDLLATVAILLRRYDRSAVTVSGFTDTAGAPDQNLALSQKRAKTVSDALAKDGVAPARLHSEGFGETNLKVRTGDDKSEPRNRRIEIRITPTPAG